MPPDPFSMRLITRHVTAELLRAFLFACAALMFLWLVYDLFDSLTDLIQAQATLPFILRFYASQLPKVLQLILPVAFLGASLFTLTTLAQHREIVALEAAGVHLLRIGFPVILLGFAISGLQYYLFHDLSPRAEDRRESMEDELTGRDRGEEIHRNVVFRDPATATIWYIEQVNVDRNEIRQAEILVPRPEGGDHFKIFARTGRFDGTAWTFENVRRVDYRTNGNALDPVDLDILTLPELSTRPRELVAVLRPPEIMPWHDLATFVRSDYRSSPARMAPYDTEHHYRLAYPLMPPVLALFALALGTGHTRRNVAASVFNCIFILFAFQVWFNLSLALGTGKRLSPPLAAWNTVVLFGLIGLWLFARRSGLGWSLLARWPRPLRSPA
ncbi:MAG: LptF/LptG family permease [Verrucomicrobiia bacterium]